MVGPGDRRRVELGRFGTSIFPHVSPGGVVAWARAAEAAGFDFVGIPDSPLIVRESYAMCMAIAATCDTIGITPLVTNPVTRHPSTAASALVSINELAPGRAFAIVGTGDSSVHMIGKPSARLSDVAAYVMAVRGLTRGDEVDWDGATFGPAWPNHEYAETKVWMSCHGPKSMYLAGQVADGVVSGFGMRPENIAFVKEQVATGAVSVGRDPAEIEIWWHPIVTLARSWSEENLVGLSVHFLFEHGLDGKQVPDELHEPLKILHSEMGAWRGSDQFGPETAARAKDLGVYDYLFEREGGFAGSAHDLRDRVSQLNAAGADRLILAPYGDGRALMRRLADEVLPAF